MSEIQKNIDVPENWERCEITGIPQNGQMLIMLASGLAGLTCHAVEEGKATLYPKTPGQVGYQETPMETPQQAINKMLEKLPELEITFY